MQFRMLLFERILRNSGLFYFLNEEVLILLKMKWKSYFSSMLAFVKFSDLIRPYRPIHAYESRWFLAGRYMYICAFPEFKFCRVIADQLNNPEVFSR